MAVHVLQCLVDEGDCGVGGGVAGVPGQECQCQDERRAPRLQQPRVQGRVHGSGNVVNPRGQPPSDLQEEGPGCESELLKDKGCLAGREQDVTFQMTSRVICFS